MASIQSLGIGSGLLTSELLDKLIEAERAPVAARLDVNEAITDAKISAYGELRSALSSLETALKSLTLVSTFNANTATSSDDKLLTATASSLAAAGSYNVSVNRLAQSHSVASGSYSSVNEVVGTGVLTFRLGTTTFDEQGNYSGFSLNASAQSKSILIGSANNTLAGIRDAVNAGNFGVQASIVDDGSGFRLLFTSRESGEKQSIELTASGSAGLRALSYNQSSQNATLYAGTQAGSLDLSLGGGLDTDSRAFRLSHNGIAMDVVVPVDAGIGNTTQAVAAIQAALDQQLLANGFAAGAVIAEGTGDRLSFRTAANGFNQTLNVLTDGTRARISGGNALSDGFDFSVDNASFRIALDGGAEHQILINTESTSRAHTVQLINEALTAAGIGADVTASLNSSNELVFTRTAYGSAVGITISAVDDMGTAGSLELGLADAAATGLDGFGLNTGQGTVTGSSRLSQTMAAQDASFSVNGVSVTRGNNLVVGVIPGTTLNLKSVTSGPVTLTIGKDASNAVTKVQSFVTAYNDLKGLADALTAYKPEAGGDKGQASLLTGETTMRFISTEINKLLRDTVNGLTGNVRSLADVGITTDQNAGYQLQFDAAKFSARLTSNSADVQALFANSGRTTDSQISYSGINAQTQPGTYSVEITRLATVGSYAGAIVNSLAAGNIVIDDSNNGFTVELNGVPAAITLTSGTYETAAQLAEQIQLQINSAQALSQGRNSVAVTFNSEQNKFELSSNLYGSDSRIRFTAVDSGVADTLGFRLAGQGDFRSNQMAGLATATGNPAEFFIDPVVIDSPTSFRLSINGSNTALLTMPGDADNPVSHATPNDLVAAVQALLDADPVFQQPGIPAMTVSYSYNAETELGRLIFSTGSHGDTITVFDTTAGAASRLGLFIGNGASNPVTYGMDVAGKINGVEATGMGQTLVGASGSIPASPGYYLNRIHGNLTAATPSDTFKVAVDGVVSGDISLGNLNNGNPQAAAMAMQTAINNSPSLIAAGVSVLVQFDEQTGGFGIISGSTGVNSKVQIVDLQGNAGAIYGFATGSGALGAPGRAASGTPDAASGLRLEVTGGELGARGTVSFIRGVGDRLKSLVTDYLGKGGLLANRTTALEKELTVIAEKRAALAERIARSEERLRASFLANDLVISKMNTTADFLKGQLEMLEALAINTVKKKR